MLNPCTNTGVAPVIETTQEPGKAPKHRVMCGATGEATDWADNIPDVVAAWNNKHPAPKAPVPTIPVIPQKQE